MSPAPVRAPLRDEATRREFRERMQDQRILERLSCDDGTRKLPAPSQVQIAAAARIIDDIDAAEREWSLLMMCREVGLYLSPPSSLNPAYRPYVAVSDLRTFRTTSAIPNAEPLGEWFPKRRGRAKASGAAA